MLKYLPISQTPCYSLTAPIGVLRELAPSHHVKTLRFHYVWIQSGFVDVSYVMKIIGFCMYYRGDLRIFVHTTKYIFVRVFTW